MLHGRMRQKRSIDLESQWTGKTLPIFSGQMSLYFSGHTRIGTSSNELLVA
jgi:hypothetical protein